MNVDTALKQSLTQTCLHCGRNGASVKCFNLRYSSVFRRVYINRDENRKVSTAMHLHGEPGAVTDAGVSC